MKKKQLGFTLIELVMVIVILGVLSAVALPKFVSLKSEAAQAAIDGAAGAVNSAMAVNYAAYQAAGTAKAVQLSAADAVAALTSAGNIVGWNSDKFGIKSDGSCLGVAAGSTVSATLENMADTTKTASATVICTG